MTTFKNILVPVDFSEHSAHALDVAIELARHFKGRIHLIHAYPIQQVLVSPYPVALPLDLDRTFREASNKLLAEWAERVGKAGLPVETTTASDSPSEAIARCADAIRADLIVMGTRGLTGLKHVLLGSVAERTLRIAPCPVLTVEGALSSACALDDPGVLAALGRADAYPGDASAREIRSIQTHLSHVFLSGARVYKFRKPVDLGFVCFTARAERDADCLREVALNRRLAPDVYLGVAPLVLDGGRVRVGEPAESLVPGATEHCVVMRRLPEGRDALSLLERGALGGAQLDRVALCIARFHAGHGLGTPAPYAEAEWLDHCTRPAFANFDTLRGFLRDPAERAALERLESATRGFAREHAGRFEARRRAGRALDAHGDLHLQHVWFERDDAPPIAIDCLEFDPELRRIEAASEVAFLAMDLRYRGAAPLAERFLRVYAAERDDYDLYRVVDWFESYRAGVRAKVAAIAAGEAGIDAAQRARAAESAQRHLALALACLEARGEPALVLVGGAVGTGKSTLASALADALGAAIVSSDRVRKQRLALPAAARAPASAYTAEAKAEVYRAVLERAQAVVESGRVAILDASWGARRERDAALAQAAAWRAPAFFVETRCAPEVAEARLAERARAGRDPSDAGPALHAASRLGFEPLGDWPEALRCAVATDEPGWRASLERVAERVRQLRGRPAG